MYPNWDFCFENKPSGNPDRHEASNPTCGQRQHPLTGVERTTVKGGRLFLI
jgi:hypothetical protein